LAHHHREALPDGARIRLAESLADHAANVVFAQDGRIETVAARRLVAHSSILRSTIVDENPAHGRLHVGTGQGESKIGFEETGLVAAIEALSLIAQAKEVAARGDKLRQGIGQLNLAAGAALELRQMIEDLRLEDIVPDDRERRRRV